MAKAAGFRHYWSSRTRISRLSLILPHLPKNVRVIDGRYYYRKREDGGRVQLPLTRVSQGESALYAELAKITTPQARTISGLLDAYLTSGMDDLAAKTRKAYTSHIKTLRLAFGEMRPQDVTPGHIAQYLETRKRMGKAVSGNRERAVLSSVYNYALRLGLLDSTPFTASIRRNKETPRTRYIRDDEFDEFLQKVNSDFRYFLEFAYLTGLRSGEIRELRREQIRGAKLILEESKTGKQVIIEITTELRSVIDRAATDSPWLLTNTKGQQWTEAAIQNYLRRYKPGFTLHDIRAKAESDHQDGLGLLPRYRRQRRIKPVK